MSGRMMITSSAGSSLINLPPGHRFYGGQFKASGELIPKTAKSGIVSVRGEHNTDRK